MFKLFSSMFLAGPAASVLLAPRLNVVGSLVSRQAANCSSWGSWVVCGSGCMPNGAICCTTGTGGFCFNNQYCAGNGCCEKGEYCPATPTFSTNSPSTTPASESTSSATSTSGSSSGSSSGSGSGSGAVALYPLGTKTFAAAVIGAAGYFLLL